MLDTSTLCPGCFANKGNATVCPDCGYAVAERHSPLLLPPLSGLRERFLIGRALGKPGGFGITYLGFDTTLEAKVAIKEYFPRELVGRDYDHCTLRPHTQDDDELFRYGLGEFLGEARTLARFNHINVVRVRDFFEANGTAYLVMDYYEGTSLAGYAAQQGGRLPYKQALSIMLPVLDGLREVHSQGFLHRDIKPQNIYLTTGGLPILLDFGAARMAMGERSRSLSVMLTEGFAPYEQYQRRGQQGPWTDIYAAAATLYYLITGEVPPPATDRRVADELQAPSAVVSDVPKHLDAVLLKALSVDVGQRPPEVRSFSEELLAVLQGRAVPSAPPVPKPPEPEPLSPERPKDSPGGSPDILGKEFRDRLQDGSAGPEMIMIPAGTFLMGSPPNEKGRGNDERQHEVKIEQPFAIGKYAVTFEDYDRFAEVTDRNNPKDMGWGRGRRPVIHVSWHDAVAYADWLSKQTGERYRLPTEAEWEYAARAGTQTAYWWGNRIGNNRANCNGCGSRWDSKKTAPVGSFEKNSFGLYDTAGNVWEWTCSEYEADYGGKERVCLGNNRANSGVRLVIRGGSWDGYPRRVRLANRNRIAPGDRFNSLSFRLARPF